MLIKTITVFLLLLNFIKLVSADPIRIDISPQYPQERENFFIRFKIQTSSGGVPEILFDSSDMDILSKRSEGVSLQTVMINGKFSTRRELIYAFEMNAPKSGDFKISNIKIKLGNKTFNHQDVQIKILPRREAYEDVFVEAEVSKKDIFVGEGVDVRYYLYTKLPIVGMEVKKFPSLNKMIKRFHHINENEETVNYKGVIYRRSLKYSARIYPEVAGKTYIDSLDLRVQYRQERGNNPFGGFGLSFGRIFTKTLRSKRLTLEVKNLPKENIPSYFTGLVGKHEFKIDQGKSKYLVNEAIELRMEVHGPGALENFEAPMLYSGSALEKFDVKSEIIETGKVNAKKVFDYTYLARAPINKEPFSIELSYFDPDKLTYETIALPLPGIQVSGVATTEGQKTALDSQNLLREDNEESRQNNNLEQKTLVAPIFELSYGHTLKTQGMKWLLISLFIIVLIQLLELGVSRGWFFKRKDFDERELYRRIQKEGLTYSSLYALLNLLNPEEVDLKLLINNSSLKKASKDYFFDLIYSLEKKSFGGTDMKLELPIKRNYFRELLEVINRGRKGKTV